MPIKQRNALSRSDFEEALDYLGSNVSDIAKQTNIPRAYLSDLKNRNVRLRREHEDKLRSFLEDQGVEFEAVDPPQRGRPGERQESPHSDVQVAQVIRRSLVLDDALDDSAIARALDAQADRDARISLLLATPVQFGSGFTLPGDTPEHSRAFKKSAEEARALLAESYLLVGILRGLRGFNAVASGSEPKTLGELLAKECASSLETAGMSAQSAEEPEPAASPAAPAAASPARKSFERADLER